MEDQTAFLQRDGAGKIVLDESGNVTCIWDGGLQFQIRYSDIDFDCDSIRCTFNDKTIFIPLNNNNNDAIETQQQNDMQNTIEDDINNTEDIFSWSDASTKLFLSLYKEKVHLIGRQIKNKKVFWQKIAKEMHIQGYNVTNIQVENKYKSLERSFKNMITNNKKTSRSRASCPYERELTDLLGKKHNIEPVIISGNKGTSLRTERATPMSMRYIGNTLNPTKSNEALSEEVPVILQKGKALRQEPSTSTSTKMDDEEDAIPVETQQHKVNATFQANISSTSRRAMGTTARFMQSCEERVKTLTEHIQEGKRTKNEIDRQILSEYKLMREAYETHLKKIEDQLVVANKLREERNNLLKTFLEKYNNK